MNNQKKETENFSFSLALMDTIPVILFGIGFFVLAYKMGSFVFGIGTGMCVIAGLSKVLWKLVLAVWKKDYRIFTKIFHMLMPTGFLVLVVSVVLSWKHISFAVIFNAMMGFPQNIFFLMGILCMCGMVVLAKKMDQTDLKSNWIEQSVNSVAQLLFLLGILFCFK